MAFTAKKANATLHKGAGGSTRGMKSAKTTDGSASFRSGAKEAKGSYPFVTTQNGHKGDSRKVDRLYTD